MKSLDYMRSIALLMGLSVTLTAYSVSGAPVTGSSSGPIPDPNASGAVALPLRAGGPAALRNDYFSPVLGARFAIVQVPIGGVVVTGAKLTQDPMAGTPLAGKGLAKGDLITHLDGDRVLKTSELETHHSATTVSWIADQTQKTRTLNIFIKQGNRFANPNGPGPGPNVGTTGPPINQKNILGKWNCSCGAVWTLDQRGTKVTGNERDTNSNNDVSGTFVGNTFNFQYLDNTNGLRGNGSFRTNNTFTSMTGTIRWQNGTSTTPVLTRVGSGRGPGVNPNGGPVKKYTVIGLRNDSRQVINTHIRWGGGAWQRVQLTPGRQWVFWSEGHQQKAQLWDSTQAIDLNGTSVTLQRDPVFSDANAYGVSQNGGQIFLRQ